MSVRQVWLESFTAEAGDGDDCAGDVITLRVRNGAGTMVHETSHRKIDLFGFEDVKTPADMQVALEEWVSRYPASATTERLPPWREGEALPEHREFPFYVDDRMSRARYEHIRQSNRGMQCYVQGRESLLCLVPDKNGDRLEVIGIQSFPG